MKNFFFILSFSRSGSTTLGQKLNNHSDVDVINESWIFNLLGVLKCKKLSPLRQKYILNQLNKGQKSFTTIQANEFKDDTISVRNIHPAKGARALRGPNQFLLSNKKMGVKDL